MMTESTEHAASYYAATRHNIEFPQLKGEHRVDVVIVGGGFTCVSATHLGGKMLADAVAGDSEQFDVFSKVNHWRLPGGKWFANPAVALGMMYYRLKELL